MFSGGNGQWVRTHNEAGAKTFAAEKQLEAERERERALRARLFRERWVGRLRSLWQRLRRSR